MSAHDRWPLWRSALLLLAVSALLWTAVVLGTLVVWEVLS